MKSFDDFEEPSVGFQVLTDLLQVHQCPLATIYHVLDSHHVL
jgi:hypothetical protein